jgi:trimeric autotransporter adhesin
MNHVYRLKRSGRTQQLQPVPETARTAGKGARTGKTLAQTVWGILASVALSYMASLAHAQQAPPAVNQLPQGGVVTHGSASIQTGTTSTGNALMTVNQTSNRAVIDWTSFNVGSQSKVQFNQPSSSAVVLNNILGNNASQIYGQISANGQVFLSNANGVYFSPTAQVNVGGLVATTGTISADEFMAGKASFNRAGVTGSVVNEGQLTSTAGGYIALLAPEVRNQGVVVAQAGTVALASGESITLSFNNSGTGLTGITTTPQTIAALVENRSAVLAEGGQIILSAHALAALQGSVVKNSGQLSATSLTEMGGKIVLMADSIALTGTSRIETNGPAGGGTVLVGGDWQGSGDTRQATKVTMAQGASIEANATQQGDGGKVVLWSDVTNANSLTQVGGRIEAKGAGTGSGGQVETSGHVLNTDGIAVLAGSSGGKGGLWLLDPTDSTIGATQVASYLTSLNNGTNVLNYTTGTITWSNNVDLLKNAGGDATLTLRAGTDLTIGNGVDITSTSNKLNLVLWSGYQDAGARGPTSVGSATINTNGGHVWVGGGAQAAETTTWNGLTVGTQHAAVISETPSSAIAGLKLNGTSIVTNGGDILLKGRYSKSGGDGIQALNTTLDSGSGNITLSARNSSTSVTTVGISLEGTTNFLGTGDMTFDVITSSNYAAINTDSTFHIDRGAGNVTFTANNFAGATFSVTGTGTLTVEPYGASFTSPFNFSRIAAGNSLSGLTVGKSGNLADITVDAATSVSGPINILGRDITLNAGLTATGNNTITLQGSGATTDSASGFVSASKLLLSGSGNVTLDNSTSNAVDTLAATGGSALTYLNSGALTLGMVGATNGISASGAVSIGTKTGDLTVAQNVSTTNTTASALILNADISSAVGSSTGGNLIFSGSPTVSVATGGFGKLYTGSISGSTGLAGLTNLASGSGRFRYNSDETTTRYTTALTAGLNAIFREQPTASTSSLVLSMTYGDALPTITGTGTFNGDAASYSITSRVNSSSGSIKASGTPYAINETLTGLGYLVNGNSTVSTGTLTVAAKALTMSGLSLAASKVYNGNASATVSGTPALLSAEAVGSGTSIDGKRYTGDTVSINGTAIGTYNSKDVPSASTVTFSGLSLTGADASNYSLTMQSPAAATITAKALTMGGLTVPTSKVYDGTTGSTVSGTATLLSAEAVGTGTTADGKPYIGDTVAITGTAVGTYNSKDVASASSVTFSGLSLNNNNYSLTIQSPRTATITAKALTFSGITIPSSKVYDGTTSAAISGTATLLSDEAAGSGTTTDGKPYTGDTVAITGTAVGTYNNKNVASATSVTLSGLSLNNSNYSLTIPSPTSATITAKALTMSGLTVPTSKVYNGTTAATVSGTPVLLSAQAVGTGTTADGKPYNGDTVALTGTALGIYNSKDVASASTITFSGLSLSNSNYSLTLPSPTAATITAKALTMSGLGSPDKVYDGTTSASVSGTAALQASIAAGTGTSSDGKAYTVDGVSLTGSVSGNFNSQDVASANQVTFSGLSLAGTGSSNYTLTPHAANTTARITRAPLTVTVNDDAKFVVETDRAGFNGVSYSGFVGGETSSALSGSVSISRSNASTNASGTYTGVLSATGLTSSNYSISYRPGGFTITPANQLLVDIASASSTYGTATQYTINSVKYYNDPTNDGIDNGTVYTLGSGGIAGSSVSINSSNLVNINDGSGGAASFTLTPKFAAWSQGNKLAAGSYALGVSGAVTSNSANFNNTITVRGAHQVNTKGITASASNVSKPYDGTTGMAGVSLNLSTLETNDVVTVNGSGAFSDKNVGTGLNYAISNLALSGSDAGNYHLTGSGSFSGSNGVITSAPLTVTANNASKTYDGVAYSGGNGVSYSGLVGGESASVLSGTLSYGGTSQGATNAGTGYTIIPSGLTSSNYTISYANGTLTINPATVTVTTINGALQGTVSKVYDGTNTATLTSANYALTGWLGSDGATVTKTRGVYDSANAGRGKTVTVSLNASDYTATSGTHLSNYTLPSSISGAVGTITDAPALPIPPSHMPTVKTVPEVMAKSTVIEAVQNKSYAWPPGKTMVVPEKSEAGLLAVTFLHASDAPPAASAVAFEQDAEKISVKMAAMPLVRPVGDKVVASGKLSEFMVANANGRLVEFMGSMIDGRLVIVAPSAESKQLAKSDANVVLVAAVLALGKGAPIMLAKLDSVVFDLR